MARSLTLSQVVDRRSAALNGCDNNRSSPIGCEDLIPLKADHASLPRFGDNPDCNAYRNYIEQLQTCIDTLATVPNEGFDVRWLEHELRVGIHRFQDLTEDNKTTVKLWSVNPTLFDLLECGPEACLNQRIDAIRPSTQPVGQGTNSMPAPDVDASHSATFQPPITCDVGNDSRPILKIQTDSTSQRKLVNSRHEEEYPPRTASTLVETDQEVHTQSHQTDEAESQDDDSQSDTSTPSAYSLPETYRFRWIHIPCNNPLWVDKLFLAVERERENKEFEKIAESTPSTSNDETMYEHALKKPVPSEAPTELLECPLENPLASHLLKAKELVEQKGFQSPGLKEALMDCRIQTHLLKLAQEVPSIKKTNSIPEAAQIVNDIHERRIIVDTLKQRAREGRSPDLSFINQKLCEDRTNVAKLSSAVLHEDYWLRQQKTSRHDLPHGRYMQHSCKLFLPKKSVDPHDVTVDTLQHYLASISSPIESPQLCLFVSIHP